MKLPKVLIVGRKNVGKSTLFNRLSEQSKSLVLDYEGVTRDFISDIVSWKDKRFELIDSGGIGLKKSQDPLEEEVRKVSLSLLDKADVILFLCDGIAGVTAEDQALAKELRKLGKPVILVVNKIDSQDAQENEHEFYRLGIDIVCTLSAQHGTGTSDLLDLLLDNLPDVGSSETSEPAYRVVLLGKPNVGKSSLMNTLMKADRSLVTDIPGTTREAVSEERTFCKETLLLTDTPGIRRKRGVTDTLEKMMVKTSFRAVDHGDVVVLIIDGSTGQISDQELKLAFYAFDNGKALLFLINKDDIMTDEARASLDDQFDYYKHFFNKVPRFYISCKTGKNVGKILPMISDLWKRNTQDLSRYKLTDICKEALTYRPLYRKGELLIVRTVKQIKKAPITLMFWVNHPDSFGPSQFAFFENVLRKKFDLLGVPLILKSRKG